MSAKTTQSFKPFNGSLNNGEMLRVLNRVSTELFDVFKFNHWNNVIISGGYALDLLLETNTGDDIDMFIYNANKELISSIYQQIVSLTGGKVLYETGAVVTLTSNKGKKVQIINASGKKTPEEVIRQFDINPCKVYFDGYGLKWDTNAVNELKTHTIDLTQIYQTDNSHNRIAKYAQHKGWKLDNINTVTQNIDPLYLFKECHSFDKLFQNLFLLNNDTLNKVYEMIFIRKNPNLNAIRNNSAMSYNYGGKITDKTHKNIGLSSQIELRPEVTEKPVNKFGLPEVLYKVKTGNYKFDELFESLDSDISGFNVSCYMIMYEPSEERVIEYFNNSEKFSSKNMNKYNLSYAELSALLNRLKLVKFFLKKNNFKNIMKIAVHEDNVELYKMTYKLISSEERYMFKKEQLLQQRAYSICEELYGELKESEKQQDTNTNTTQRDKHYQDIDNLSTVEGFIKYYYENQQYKKKILDYLVLRSVKNIVETDYRVKTNSVTQIEKSFCEHEMNKINTNTNQKFNQFLMSLQNQEKTYTAQVLYNFTNPLDNLEHRYMAIRMSEGYLDPTYNFGVSVINKLLVFLDNTKLIENTKNKKQLFENVLTVYQKDLGPNFTEYMKRNYERVSSIKYYSQVLSNSEWHDSAYDNNTLDVGYLRVENAIGYTPDDIIIFKTINDHFNNAKPNHNRSQSIKNIERNKKIVPFVGTVDKNKVKQVIPEMFNFDNVLENSSNNNNGENNHDNDYEELVPTTITKKVEVESESESEDEKPPTRSVGYSHPPVKKPLPKQQPVTKKKVVSEDESEDEEPPKSSVFGWLSGKK
jgi:hypothetical protein